MRSTGHVEGPRLVVASDGSAAALLEPDHVRVSELPRLALRCEVGIDPEADGTDLAFLGTPPRLLVVSRYAQRSVVHLVDPSGPRKLDELRLESVVRILASSGDHALIASAPGSTGMIAAAGESLSAGSLPVRAAPAAASAMTSGQFLLNVSGALEVWDAATKLPARRFRSSQPMTARAIGGTAHSVWLVPTGDLRRIEVIPLINRGQALRFELPEPISAIAGHHDLELLLVVGADSRQVYLIDLLSQSAAKPLGSAVADAVVLAAGRTPCAVLARGGALEVVALGDSGLRAPRGDGGADVDLDPDPLDQAPDLRIESGPVPGAMVIPAPEAAPIAQRLLEWRERIRAAATRDELPERSVRIPDPPTWRDDLAAWARGILAAAGNDPPPVAPGSPLALVLARAALPGELARAVALLYGARLLGLDGVAPIDLARIIGRRWDEALGRGRLADEGLVVARRSRILLAAPARRVLDEHPAPDWAWIGAAAAERRLARSCAVIGTGRALAALAADYVEGAVVDLGAVPRDRLRRLAVEATLRGAVPLIEGVRAAAAVGTPPVVVAVRDADEAAGAGLTLVDLRAR